MADIELIPINQSFLKIKASPSILMELHEKFTFMAPNYRFSPLFKNKVWDGKIRLLNALTAYLPRGLASQVEKYAEEMNYEIISLPESGIPPISDEILKEFISGLSLDSKYITRDFQFEGLRIAIDEKRRLFVSSTGSGKSFIIFLIVSWMTYVMNKKILIVVPSIQLVSQLKTDFLTYKPDFDFHIHEIYGGQEKTPDHQITISTYQSIKDLPPQFFEGFDVVICDEAHQAKAKSIKKIVENCINAEDRFGFTGTLDDMETNQLTIEGLFGPVVILNTTEELIEAGILSPIEIKIPILSYSDDVRKQLTKMSYNDEVNFLQNYEQRNNFIKNLAIATQGNTLVLFKNIDHGKALYELIKNSTNRRIHFIYGKIPVVEREEIRKIIDDTKTKNDIIIASYGTLAQGVNIVMLHNIIFASFYKAKIKVLQSIGRGLRNHKDKDKLLLFDIADDLQWKKHENFSIKHLKIRIQFYIKQGFKFNYISHKFK